MSSYFPVLFLYTYLEYIVSVSEIYLDLVTPRCCKASKQTFKHYTPFTYSELTPTPKNLKHLTKGFSATLLPRSPLYSFVITIRVAKTE